MIISSKKAAEFLNVNESTIKRWADKGKIKSHKTPGGHRKFKMEDLKKVSEENNYLVPFDFSPVFTDKIYDNISNRNFSALTSAFGKILLRADSEPAYQMLYLLYLNKVPVAEIFDELVRKTMQNIGDLWSKGIIGVEDEHIATNTLMKAIIRFENDVTDRFFSVTSKNLTAVCAGLEKERHDIGLHCVKIALKHLRWKVVFPGTNTPAESIINLLKNTKPDILCLSLKSDSEGSKIKTEIYKIIDYTKEMNIRVFAGGITEPGEDSDRITRVKDIVSLIKHLKSYK
ncbi:MAG: helix-turn-helix domain-containing protein [Bacteroidetes bacterium]|nr:helix-turn-helix domain-containing protein [Bacteroidota bacterium]